MAATRMVESGVFQRVVLPTVAVLEVVNLVKVGKVAYEHTVKDEYIEAAISLTPALIDLGAVSAQINEFLFKQRYAKAHGYKLFDRLPQAVKDAAPKAPIISARVLGLGASVVSAGFAFKDMLLNLSEGDDAAYAHMTYGLGFSLMAATETAGFLVAVGAASKTGSMAAFAAGPWLLVGLLLVLAGAALLSFVFTEDSELELWLKYSPFSKEPEPLLLKGAADVEPYGLYPKPGQLLLVANLHTSPGTVKGDNDVAHTWRFKEDAFIRLSKDFRVIDIYTDGHTLIQQGDLIYTKAIAPTPELFGGRNASLRPFLVPDAYLNRMEAFYSTLANNSDYQPKGMVNVCKGDFVVQKAQLISVAVPPKNNTDPAWYLRFADDSRLILNRHYQLLDISGNLSSDSIAQESGGLYYLLPQEARPQWIGRMGDRLNLLPFENTKNRFKYQAANWKTDGEACFKALVSAIAKPTVSLRVDEINSRINYINERPPEYVAYAEIHLPYFIDDRSKLIVELTANQKSIIKDNIRQYTFPGHGPKSIRLEQPVLNYAPGHYVFELKVRIDVLGDGKAILPLSQDWLVASETKTLGTHQYAKQVQYDQARIK
jgi:hypothetical protein